MMNLQLRLMAFLTAVLLLSGIAIENGHAQQLTPLAGNAGAVRIISNNTAFAAGISSSVWAQGSLDVTMPPSTIFNDPFDGALDTTNRWTTQVSGGTVTSAAGLLSVLSTTTALNYAAIFTQPTFPTLGAPFQIAAATVVVPAVKPTNNAAYWGIGSVPGSPTTAAPITDGIGFLFDTDGAFKAVLYAAGVRTVACTLTAPADGAQHGYAIVWRADVIFWLVDTENVPVCVLPGVQTAVSGLPLTVLSVNSAGTPATTPSIGVSLATVADLGKNNQQISDGTFAWRKATVTTGGGLATTGSAIAYTTTAPTVTNANTTSLAANTSRKFLQIQNNDAAGNVFVCFTVVCTLTTGTKLLPAQSFTMTSPPSNAITTIGSIASNANVIFVEGQ